MNMKFYLSLLFLFFAPKIFGMNPEINIPDDQEYLLLEGDATEEFKFVDHGKYLVSKICNDAIKVWDPTRKSNHCVLTINDPHDGCEIHSANISHDGRYAVSAGDDVTIKIWDITKEIDNLIRVIDFGPVNREQQFADFSYDGKLIVGLLYELSGPWIAQVWDITKEKGKEECIFSVQATTPLCFSHNSKYLLCRINDSVLKVFDIIKKTDNCIFEDEAPRAIYFTSAQFSSDDKYIVACNSNGQINIYDMVSNACIKKIETRDCDMISVEFNQDNKYVVCGLRNGTIKIWDLETDACIKTIVEYLPDPQHRGYIPDFSVRFSSDYRYLITTNLVSGEIRIRDFYKLIYK